MPPEEREQTLWGALLFFGKAGAFRARRSDGLPGVTSLAEGDTNALENALAGV